MANFAWILQQGRKKRLIFYRPAEIRVKCWWIFCGEGRLWPRERWVHFSVACAWFSARAARGLSDAELLRRFVAVRDEAAFEVLLWRHGPMVLGLARRLLSHSQDAEDVFQATFLALARKASSLRHPEGVGSWLHQVACRAALRLRPHCPATLSSRRCRRNRSPEHRRRFGRARPGSGDARGDQPPSREIPRPDRPLLPGRPDNRGSVPAPGLPTRHRLLAAGDGPGAAALRLVRRGVTLGGVAVATTLVPGQPRPWSRRHWPRPPSAGPCVSPGTRLQPAWSRSR